MRYKGKSVEIIGSKTLFGKETLWVHVLEDNTFMQVQRTDLVEDDVNTDSSGMAYVRYVSIAARIKEEMAQKRLLAPYESSLTPLPHQILVLEKVMQGVQTQVKSDIIQRFGENVFLTQLAAYMRITL